jgi:hypothetical protein
MRGPLGGRVRRSGEHMASTAELRNALLKRLGAQLSPMGFRKSEQAFAKRWGAGKLLVHLSFVRHADDFDVLVDVAVRHDPIEDRLNADRPQLSKRERSKTATVGVELGNWSLGRPLRWTVSTPADLDPVGRQLLEEVCRTGLPFLEQFAQLEELERVLAADDKMARLICPIAEKRSAVLAIVRELQGGRAA